jgi:hypothetical protein
MHIAELPERRVILGNMTDFNGSADLLKEFMRFCKTDSDTTFPALYLTADLASLCPHKPPAAEVISLILRQSIGIKGFSHLCTFFLPY